MPPSVSPLSTSCSRSSQAADENCHFLICNCVAPPDGRARNLISRAVLRKTHRERKKTNLHSSQLGAALAKDHTITPLISIISSLLLSKEIISNCSCSVMPHDSSLSHAHAPSPYVSHLQQNYLRIVCID